MNPILYILVNKELNMSVGKAAAQAVHAAMMVEKNHRSLFTSQYRRTVVVLEAKNSETIRNLKEYLAKSNIWSDYYIDEGVNEVSPFSITALAVEPIDSEDSVKRGIFSSFDLLGSNDYDDEEPLSSQAVVNALNRIANVLTPPIPAAKLKKLSLWQRWKNRKYQSRVS